MVSMCDRHHYTSSQATMGLVEVLIEMAAEMIAPLCNVHVWDEVDKADKADKADRASQ